MAITEENIINKCNNYTNKEIIELYLMDMRSASKNTRKTYEKHVNSLLEYLNNKSIYDIEYIDLQRFVQYLIDEIGNTITSVNLKVSALNSFFRYCNKIEVNCKKLHLSTQKDKDKKKRDNKKLRISSEMHKKIISVNKKYYTMDKTMSSLEKMRNAKEYAIFYLFLYGGMRRSEIVSLELSHVGKSVKKDVTRLRVDIIDSKREKSRRIFLNEDAYNAMSNWLKIRKEYGFTSNFIFCSEGDKRLSDTENYTFELAKKISERAEIYDENGELFLATPHAYRHNTASRLIQANIAPIEVAKFLGDTLEVILKTYVHQDTDANYDVADVL